MNGGSPKHIENSLFSSSTTTNSLSKSASRSTGVKIGAAGDRLHGNTRSLSESNFHDNNDDETERAVTSLNHHTLSVNQANAEFNSINERLLKEKREIVAKLEKQNREILKEIRRLKQKQQSNKSLDLDNCAFDSSIKHLSLKCQQQMLKNKELTNRKVSINPKLLAELMSLKERKGQLENRMQWLESSRDELIERLMQLDSLMKHQHQQPSQAPAQVTPNLLNSKAQFIPCDVVTNKYKYTSNAHQTINTMYPTIAMSTPTASGYVPHVSAAHAMPLLHKNGVASSNQNGQVGSAVRNMRSLSTPSSPALYDLYSPSRPLNLNASFNPVQLASSSSLSRQSIYDATSSQRNLKADLLIAADSVTNAMHNLVKELNADNISLNSLDADLAMDVEEATNLKLANDHGEYLNGVSAEYAEFDNTNFYAQMQLNGKLPNSETGFKANPVQSALPNTPNLYKKDSNKLIKFKPADGDPSPIVSNGTAQEHDEQDDEDDDDDKLSPEENFQNYFLNNKTTTKELYYPKVLKANHHHSNNKNVINDLKYFDFNNEFDLTSHGEQEREEEVAKSIDDQVAQWMRELEQRLDTSSMPNEQTVNKEHATLDGHLDHEELIDKHQEHRTTTSTTTTTITTTASLINST